MGYVLRSFSKLKRVTFRGLGLFLFLAALGISLASRAFPISISWTIPSSQIVPLQGNMFAARLSAPAGLQAIFDEPDRPRASRAQLAENGTTLGPPHSFHGYIAKKGEGRFSLWNGYLRFSSSNNSDPRINGYSYQLSYEVEASPYLISAVCVLILLLLASLRYPAVLPSTPVAHFAENAWSRSRTYIRSLYSAAVDRSGLESIVLASVTVYLLGVASGGASFLVEHSHGLIGIAISRAVLLMLLAAAPLAAIVSWSDSFARRYFLGSLTACASIGALIAATHLKQTLASPADRALVLSLCEMVCYGTLLVHLRGDRVIRASVGSVLLLSSLLCLAQTIGLGPLGLDRGRSSALYDNPNIAAVAIGLLCFGLSSTVSPKQPLRWICLSALAIASTLSRSGAVAFLAAFFFVPELRRFRTKAIFVAVSLLTSLWILATFIPEASLPQSLLAAKAALADCSQLIANLAHGSALPPPHDGTAVVSSGVERLSLLLRSWTALWAHPLAGKGLDFAHELAPHNSFILFGVAFGVVGMAIPLAWYLPGLCIDKKSQLAKAVFIFVALTFSHDLMLVVPLVACGIYCATSSPSRSEATVPSAHYPFNLLSGGRLASWLSHSNPWQSAAIVSVLSATSMVAGFARTAVIAGKFGASAPVDAYYLALIIPVYLTTLVAGLLQVSFLPFYARSLVSDVSKAGRIRSTVFWILAGAACCLAVLFAKFAPLALPLLSASNVTVGGLAVSIAPMIAAVFFTNILGDYFGIILNGHKRFAVAAASPALNALVSSLGLFLSDSTAFALAEMLVLGGLIQLLINASALAAIRTGFSVKDFRFSEIFKPLSRLIAPALPGVAFSATSLAILNASAANLGPGSLSLFGYAWRLYGIPSQIFVLSIGTILLPHFSQLLEVDNRARLKQDLLLLAKVTWLGSLVALAVCYVYGDTLVYAIFGWGHFSRADSSTVNLTLLGLLASLFFFSYGTFLSRLLTALYKNLFVSGSSLITLVLIVIYSFLFQGWHSLLRVSLSLSLGYAAATLFMQVSVVRFLDIEIRWPEIASFLARSLVAVGVATAATVPVFALIENAYLEAAFGASSIAGLFLLFAVVLGLIDLKLPRGWIGKLTFNSRVEEGKAEPNL